MSDAKDRDQVRDAREEMLWHLGVELEQAEEAIEFAELYTETVHIGGRSYGLGQVVRDLRDSVNRLLETEGE